MAGDAAGSPYTLHDPEQRLYKVATCQPLGYIDPAGEFRKPKSLPAQFARVTAPTPQDFAFLHERMGDLRVGLLRSGEDTIDLEVGIKGETLTSHVGVFATTGMGKSNLMKVLAGQILSSQGRYACLLFDPHGEYLEGGSGIRRGLREHPWAADRLRVYATRAAGAGATALRLSLGELTLGDLQTAYDWSHPQEDAIYRLIRFFHEEWIVRVGEEQDVSDLAEQLGRRDEHPPGDPASRPADLGHAVHLARSVPAVAVRAHRRRADGRLLGARRHERSVVHGGDPRRIGHHPARARRVRLGLPGRPRAVRRPATDARSRWRRPSACSRARRARTRTSSPGWRGRGGSSRSGLCAVSQQPKLIDDELLSQFNTFFILGLADEKDRTILRGSSKQDITDLGPEIQTLMPGEAIVTNLDSPFALPAMVYLYEEYLKSVQGPSPLPPRPSGGAQGFAE